MEEPKIATVPIAEKGSSYKRWVASEEIPIIEGFFIEDIRKVPLEPWKRAGGLGCSYLSGGYRRNQRRLYLRDPSRQGA